MAILITGGARSGKSDFAEQYAVRLASEGLYLATSQIWDEEMRERVEQHRAIREESGFRWTTVEEPLALTEQLRRLQAEYHDQTPPVVLVDCLTLWLSNQLLAALPAGLEGDPAPDAETSRHINDRIEELVEAVAAYTGPLLLVTNEVGSGIVPAYPLGRRFRDAAGRLNRKLAAVCGEAYLVVAGLPLDLKKLAFKLEER